MSDTGALVYVVDDDPSAREGVARLIRSAGLMTKTFASGEEFLAAARPTIPSCLVLDVNLPGLSGLDVQKELIKSGAQIPVIFLTGAPWPGNVRELENFIERCVIVTPGEELKVPSPELKRSLPRTAAPASTFEEVGRQAIVEALQAASGRISGKSGAAERLGLKRSTLQNKMRKLNISKADYTGPSINLPQPAWPLPLAL